MKLLTINDAVRDQSAGLTSKYAIETRLFLKTNGEVLFEVLITDDDNTIVYEDVGEYATLIDAIADFIENDLGLSPSKADEVANKWADTVEVKLNND